MKVTVFVISTCNEKILETVGSDDLRNTTVSVLFEIVRFPE